MGLRTREGISIRYAKSTSLAGVRVFNAADSLRIRQGMTKFRVFEIPILFVNVIVMEPEIVP